MSELLQTLPAARASTERDPSRTLEEPAEHAGRADHALSHNQQAQWFLHRLAPGASAYHTGLAVRIRSAVDVAALGEAVRLLGLKHEMLRSLFLEKDGVPVRRVSPQSQVRLEIRPVRDFATEVRQTLHEPYALDRTGAFRIVLHTRAADDSVLLIAGHHIACDAASHAVMLADLLARYEHLVTGEPLPPESEPGDFDAYVAKEQQLIDSPFGRRLEAHWTELCQGSKAVTLPADHPRPPRQGFSGATVQILIPADTAAGLRRCARNLGVSPFAFLLGVFQGVLYRCTRQADFLIGCPVATRLSSRSRGAVGDYINTVVFRGRFTPTTTFGEAAAEADRQFNDAVAVLRDPFAHLARVLADTRAGGQPAVYQVTFNMLSAGYAPREVRTLIDGSGSEQVTERAGLRLHAFRLPQQEGQVDLGVDVLETEDALRVDLRYDSGLFELETVERFAGFFRRAVELACEAPHGVVARAPLWASSRTRPGGGAFRPAT